MYTYRQCKQTPKIERNMPVSIKKNNRKKTFHLISSNVKHTSDAAMEIIFQDVSVEVSEVNFSAPVHWLIHISLAELKPSYAVFSSF